ncbi:MAG: 3'-5' exonuclease [Candidatus Pacearchaeota archaeon]
MKTLVIDTETTGLYPRYNKVLTVGMLFADIEKDFFEIVSSKHIFIKHENYNIDPQALAVNKINIDQHDKIAIRPNLACKKINSFIEKNNLNESQMLGHNINFDRGFLRELFKKEGLNPIFPRDHIDTMQIWNHLKRKNIVSFNLRNNLGTLAEFFNIDYSNAHGALEDCHITANVYHKMLGLI